MPAFVKILYHHIQKVGILILKMKNREKIKFSASFQKIRGQLIITAILSHIVTQQSCHFRKILTVSHFRLILFQNPIFFKKKILNSNYILDPGIALSKPLMSELKRMCIKVGI